MPTIIDDRKRDSVQVEFIADGFYKISTDANNIPEFLYFGENAQIKKITKHFLANTIEEIFQEADAIKGTKPTNNSETLIGINGPSERIYINNEYYYAYSKLYLSLPAVVNPPENKKTNKRTQVNLSGYTIDGEPIIAGGSKGLIITENYISDGNDIPIQGTFDDNNNLITSVSKSNKRIINNNVYYDITTTVQEL